MVEISFSEKEVNLMKMAIKNCMTVCQKEGECKIYGNLEIILNKFEEIQ